jgi:hypothetical protein
MPDDLDLVSEAVRAMMDHAASCVSQKRLRLPLTCVNIGHSGQVLALRYTTLDKPGEIVADTWLQDETTSFVHFVLADDVGGIEAGTISHAGGVFHVVTLPVVPILVGADESMTAALATLQDRIVSDGLQFPLTSVLIGTRGFVFAMRRQVFDQAGEQIVDTWPDGALSFIHFIAVDDLGNNYAGSVRARESPEPQSTTHH